MKTFLLKDKLPFVKWGMIPDNTFFQGEVPEGYSLAVSPSKGFIIIDIDTHGTVNGFSNLPMTVLSELGDTLNYKTKNGGQHFWLEYTGNKVLMNKTSKLGIDLRTYKGYVVWYHSDTIQNCMHKIKKSSTIINDFIEKLFSEKNI